MRNFWGGNIVLYLDCGCGYMTLCLLKLKTVCQIKCTLMHKKSLDITNYTKIILYINSLSIKLKMWSKHGKRSNLHGLGAVYSGVLFLYLSL